MLVPGVITAFVGWIVFFRIIHDEPRVNGLRARLNAVTGDWFDYIIFVVVFAFSLGLVAANIGFYLSRKIIHAQRVKGAARAVAVFILAAISVHGCYLIITAHSRPEGFTEFVLAQYVMFVVGIAGGLLLEAREVERSIVTQPIGLQPPPSAS
jgi:uncharacterized protein YneF (UPF0154 family)